MDHSNPLEILWLIPMGQRDPFFPNEKTLLRLISSANPFLFFIIIFPRKLQTHGLICLLVVSLSVVLPQVNLEAEEDRQQTCIYRSEEILNDKN